LGSRGLQILGFPCNQFGKQEPGDDAAIQANAKNPESKAFATFPIFAKIDVNGDAADPLYTYLTHAALGVAGSVSVKWNFSKFIVDKDGHVLKRYAPTTSPKAIAPDIQQLLDA